MGDRKSASDFFTWLSTSIREKNVGKHFPLFVNSLAFRGQGRYCFFVMSTCSLQCWGFVGLNIVGSRFPSARRMYLNIIPKLCYHVWRHRLNNVGKVGVGKKVGRAAANRTMALQADILVPMSCYSAVAILSNVTREYERLFSNASSERCVCNAPSLSHAILRCEESTRILSLIHV